MEILGADDPVKGQLLKKSAMHREQLQEEVKLISDKTQQILTNAIIIGGALAVAYVLVSGLTSEKRSRKRSKPAKIRLVQPETQEAETAEIEPESPGVMAQIGSALASQAAVFLLAMAKEKLTEFLQAQTEKKSTGNEPAS